MKVTRKEVLELTRVADFEGLSKPLKISAIKRIPVGSTSINVYFADFDGDGCGWTYACSFGVAIVIKRSLSDKEKADTILHETVHALTNILGHKHIFLSRETEEIFAYALGTIGLDLVKLSCRYRK